MKQSIYEGLSCLLGCAGQSDTPLDGKIATLVTGLGVLFCDLLSGSAAKSTLRYVDSARALFLGKLFVRSSLPWLQSLGVNIVELRPR